MRTGLRPPLLILISLIARGSSDICSFSFCDCDNEEVLCQGDGEGSLVLTPVLFPRSISSLFITNISKVVIQSNTFRESIELKEISLENINEIILEQYFFSSGELPTLLESFRLENLQKLTIESENCFEHFPRSKKISFRYVNIETIPSRGLKLNGDIIEIIGCKIEETSRAAIFVETLNLQIVENEFTNIKAHAFSGNADTFNFSSNQVTVIEEDPFLVTGLTFEFSYNKIEEPLGSLFNSLSPTPICVPDMIDPSYYYESEDVEYRKVASPSFTLKRNTFVYFNDTLLLFGDLSHIPLGNLMVQENSINCDCQQLKSTVELLEIRYQSAVTESLEHFILMEEFYSSAVCISRTNHNTRVISFVRDNFEVSENSVSCSEKLNRDSNKSQNSEKETISKIYSDAEENLPPPSDSQNSSSDSQFKGYNAIIACYLSVNFVMSL